VQLSSAAQTTPSWSQRQLRFDLAQKAQRITFFFPEGRRIMLLTTFRKQRQDERAEVARARQAMARSIAEGHTVEGEMQ
jgi:hypothetical protein